MSDTPPRLNMSISDEKTGMDSPGGRSEDTHSSYTHTQKLDTIVDEKLTLSQDRISTEIASSPSSSQPINRDVEAAKPRGPAAPGGPEENDLYKPKSLKFWLIILSAVLSMYLVALDRTIIATAIPTITDDFKSLGSIGWYGSAYMLTTAAFQLVWGRIYRFYDLRAAFLSSIVVFEVGSAICGSAPNSPVFIVGTFITHDSKTKRNKTD